MFALIYRNTNKHKQTQTPQSIYSNITEYYYKIQESLFIMDSLILDAFREFAATTFDDVQPEPRFTRFSMLPVELRIEIWKLSLTPRFIKEKDWRLGDWREVRCPDLPLLSTSLESREQVTRVYKDIGLSVKDCRNIYIKNGIRPKVLYNPDLDIVCYDSCESGYYGPQIRKENFNARKLGPAVIYPELVRKVQVTPWILSQVWYCTVSKMVRSPSFFPAHHLRDQWLPYFPFSNLDELIIQDWDCSLEHKIDNPANRANGANHLFKMLLKIKALHPDFKIPRIKFSLGKKLQRDNPHDVSTFCCQCRQNLGIQRRNA